MSVKVMDTLKLVLQPPAPAVSALSRSTARKAVTPKRWKLRTRATASASSDDSAKRDPTAWAVTNDFPESYVLVSEDPDEVEAQVKKLAAENEALKKQVEQVEKLAAEVAGERKSEVDVTRPRADAVPPATRASVKPSKVTVAPADAPSSVVEDAATGDETGTTIECP